MPQPLAIVLYFKKYHWFTRQASVDSHIDVLIMYNNLFVLCQLFTFLSLFMDYVALHIP